MRGSKFIAEPENAPVCGTGVATCGAPGGAVSGPPAAGAGSDWSRKSCSALPARMIVTLSKPTAVRVTPGMISSPTAKLSWRPSGRAMIAEPRPVARSSRTPCQLEVERGDDDRPAGGQPEEGIEAGQHAAARRAWPERRRPSSRRPAPSGAARIQISRARLDRDQDEQQQLGRRIDGEARQPLEQPPAARGQGEPRCDV